MNELAADNPVLCVSAELRKVIYTSNAIELLNVSLRKLTKAKGAFPHDKAVFKIFWPALRSISKKMDDARQGLQGGPEPVRHPV